MHKFNAHVFHRTMQNVKRHLGAGYQHLKNVAGHIDHGVHIAKQIYSVVEPVVRHYAGNNHIHHHAMKAMGGYESIRNNVIEGDNDIKKVRKNLLNA